MVLLIAAIRIAVGMIDPIIIACAAPAGFFARSWAQAAALLAVGAVALAGIIAAILSAAHAPVTGPTLIFPILSMAADAAIIAGARWIWKHKFSPA